MDGHGFKIPSSSLEDMFDQDNVNKSEETGTSKSNEILIELGGTEGVLGALRTDIKIGINSTDQAEV